MAEKPTAIETKVQKTKRIAHRLLIAHLLLAGLTAGLVGWFAWEISCQTEDTVLSNLLKFVVEKINDDEDVDFSSMNPVIRIFKGSDALPPELDFTRELASGFHELDPYELTNREKHLLIWDRPSDGQRIYAIADAQESRDEPSTISRLLLVILVISWAGVAIGFMVTRKALKPLMRLADIVSSSEGGELPPGFSDTFENDEIGVLARRMERYMRQRERFVQGERQFLLDASHELRTPLTVLQGAIDLLRTSTPPDDATSTRRIERMERSVVRMQHTIESLLWLAHQENRALSMSKEEFARALEGLTAEWKAVLPEEIRFLVTVEQGCTLDDPLHLWLIAIRNLVENAAHHTDSGTIDVSVATDRIRVSDTGCGISEDMLSTITGTWVHGPQTRGYGLGLSIVNRIATRMGWELEIESEVDKGTIVTLERKTNREE